MACQAEVDDARVQSIRHSHYDANQGATSHRNESKAMLFFVVDYETLIDSSSVLALSQNELA